MTYLNLDLDYFTHPKTRQLIGLLGKGTAELPIRLWCFCGKHHCESGSLTDYSAQEIESIVGWWGKPEACVNALLKTGFLKRTEQGFQVHHWKMHNGHIAVFKKRARVAALGRWKKPNSNATSNATGGRKQCSYYTDLSVNKDPPSHPPNSNGAFRRLMDEFIRLTTPYRPADPDPLQQAAVGACYKRFGRAASQLLALALGNVEQAIAGVRAVAERMQSRNLSWTLETICEHYPEYLQNPEKYVQETKKPR